MKHTDWVQLDNSCADLNEHLGTHRWTSFAETSLLHTDRTSLHHHHHHHHPPTDTHLTESSSDATCSGQHAHDMADSTRRSGIPADASASSKAKHAAASSTESMHRHPKSATALSQIAAHLKQAVIKPLCLCTNQRHTRIGVGHETGYVVYALVRDRAETHEDTAVPSSVPSRTGAVAAAASNMMQQLVSPFTTAVTGAAPESSSSCTRSSLHRESARAGASATVCSASSRAHGHDGSSVGGDTLLDRRRAKTSIAHLRMDPSYNMDGSPAATPARGRLKHSSNSSSHNNYNLTAVSRTTHERMSCGEGRKGHSGGAASNFAAGESDAYSAYSHTPMWKPSAQLSSSTHTGSHALLCVDAVEEENESENEEEDGRRGREAAEGAKMSVTDASSHAVRCRRAIDAEGGSSRWCYGDESRRRGLTQAMHETGAYPSWSQYETNTDDGEGGQADLLMDSEPAHDCPDNAAHDNPVSLNEVNAYTSLPMHRRTSRRAENDLDADEEDDEMEEMSMGFEGGGVGVMALLYEQHVVAVTGGGPTPVSDRRTVCIIRGGVLFRQWTMPEYVVQLFLDARLLFVGTTSAFRVYTNPMEPEWCTCAFVMSMTGAPSSPLPPAPRCDDGEGALPVSASASASVAVSPSRFSHTSHYDVPKDSESSATAPLLSSWPCVMDYAHSCIVLRSANSPCGFTLLSYDIYNTDDSSLSGHTSLRVRSVATCRQAHKNPITGLALHVGRRPEGVSSVHTARCARRRPGGAAAGASLSSAAAPGSSSRPHVATEESGRHTRTQKECEETVSGGGGAVRGGHVYDDDDDEEGHCTSREMCLVAACSAYATRVTLWALVPVTPRASAEREGEGEEGGGGGSLRGSPREGAIGRVEDDGEGDGVSCETGADRDGARRAPGATTSAVTAAAVAAESMPQSFVLLREFRVGFKVSAGVLRLPQLAMHPRATPLSPSSPHIYHLQFLDEGQFLFCVRNNRMLVFSLETQSDVRERDLCHDREQAVHNRRSVWAAVNRVLPSRLHFESYTRQDWSSCEAALNVNDAVFHPRWLYLYKQDRAAAAMWAARERAHTRARTQEVCETHTWHRASRHAPSSTNHEPACTTVSRSSAATCVLPRKGIVCDATNDGTHDRTVDVTHDKVRPAAMIGATLRGTFGRLARGIHDWVGAVHGGSGAGAAGAVCAEADDVGVSGREVAAMRRRVAPTRALRCSAEEHVVADTADGVTAAGKDSASEESVPSSTPTATERVGREAIAARHAQPPTALNSTGPPLPAAEASAEEALTQLAACLMIWEHPTMPEGSMDLYTCRDDRATVTASNRGWSGVPRHDLESEEGEMVGQADWTRSGGRRKIVLDCVTCEGAYATIRLYKDSGEMLSAPAVPFRTD